MVPSLCEDCHHMQEVVSGKGSRFLFCEKSGADNRYPKYPPQPVIQCRGFERSEHQHDEAPRSGVENKLPHK